LSSGVLCFDWRRLDKLNLAFLHLLKTFAQSLTENCSTTVDLTQHSVAAVLGQSDLTIDAFNVIESPPQRPKRKVSI